MSDFVASLMFRKILIANRGEIACRVDATARRLGMRTVAVYSDADAGSAACARLPTRRCASAPAPARESYLRGDRILEAARDTGAQAIHPGYGFLSENETFAAGRAPTRASCSSARRRRRSRRWAARPRPRR